MEAETRDDITGEEKPPFGRKQKLGIGFAVAWTLSPTVLVMMERMPGTDWKAAVAMTAMPVVMGLLGFAAWRDRS